MPGKLSGSTIVITGASSGVGRAIALCCAIEGARLILAARRKEALEQLVIECAEFDCEATGVSVDVTNADDMKYLASVANNFGGSIDVWINNAGVLAAGTFDETPIEVHEKVISTNLTGYLNGAHAVLPYFKHQGYGILINNISVGAWLPTPYAAGYSASKFGLKGFTDALRGELTFWPGIHVCDLYPYFLDTPGMQHAANYTGKSLKPAPPVCDPLNVGKAVVSLILKPKRITTIGAAARLLQFVHFLLPAKTGSITARFMNLYFKKANNISGTNGNVFEPVEYGTTIYGGWVKKRTARQMFKRNGFLVAGIAIGILLAVKKNNRVN